MTGKIYTVTKKPNSTAVPAGGSDITFTLKGACSVQAPVLLMTSKPSGNYLYIPDFSRYYWITDVVFEIGEWRLTCRVDVLATYKTQIGASSQYVLRSASNYDGAITDTLYPLKQEPTVSWDYSASGYDSDGIFVLGVSGLPVTTAKVYGLTYYVMTQAQLLAFLRAMHDASNLEQWALDTTTNVETAITSIISRLSALPSDLMEYFFQPWQYIKSCVWLPITTNDFFTLSAVTGVNMGTASIACSCYQVAGNPMNINSSITVPSHPLAATRGEYLNTAPYSQHTLYIPGVGDIPLPTGEVRGGDTLNVSAEVSVVDGSLIVDLTSVHSNGTSVIGHYPGQIGCPVPLSNASADVPAAALQIAGGAAAAFSGNALGAAAGIMGALSNSQAKVSTIGGSKGMHPLSLDRTVLSSTFWIPADEDLTNHGRPLCQVKQISTLSGYVLCENAELSVSGTAEEAREVMSYMNGGFYYE